MALALWFGYNRGYHQGLQTERRAWESTLQRETSMVTLDNRSRHVVKQFYRNPHLGILVATFPGNTSVNVPDLRNLPFNEHFSLSLTNLLQATPD